MKKPYGLVINQDGDGFLFNVGANLDALWDWLTGGMALPATICLIHAEQAAQQAEFAPVLALLEEAAQLLEGELRLVWR